MFWKKNRLIEEFAHTQADEFYSLVQIPAATALIEQQGQEASAGGARKRKGKKAKEDVRDPAVRQFQLLLDRFEKFRGDNRLGVYGKARFHMKFKARLIELGYPEPLAGEIDRALMLHTP